MISSRLCLYICDKETNTNPSANPLTAHHVTQETVQVSRPLVHFTENRCPTCIALMSEGNTFFYFLGKRLGRLAQA